MTAGTQKEIHELGELPPLGEVPEYMYAQVIRRERFGEPAKAFAWPIYPDGFSAPELLELGRLQGWTLKPARLR